MTEDYFKDIRPYTSSEVPPAIERMIAFPEFQLALDYLFPKDQHQSIYLGLKQVQSNFEFQKFFMHKVINRIMELSSDGLSLQGTENLINNGPSVLLSNHRDILLDSAILQVVLVDLGMETSEITFGSNLMINDLIIDFGKINRMFTVFREGSPREMLENSKRLSAYIHHTIQEKKLSSWIAQRKGRTKDGLDLTDTGVLKMLTTFDRKNPIEAYLAINILPVIVSYEWEPCDLLKVRELFLTDKQSYVKKPGEDLNSVLKGITQAKGKIHLAFGKPVNAFIHENMDNLTVQNIHQQVAKFIDEQVYGNYKIYPNNYLAYDMLFDGSKYSSEYTEETKDMMDQKLSELYKMMGDHSEELTKRFLMLYANPLIQKLNLQ